MANYSVKLSIIQLSWVRAYSRNYNAFFNIIGALNTPPTFASATLPDLSVTQLATIVYPLPHYSDPDFG